MPAADPALPPTTPYRRAADGVRADASIDPEALLTAVREGRRSIQSIVPVLPLGAAFTWFGQGRISEAEFNVIVAYADVQEVEVVDAPAVRDEVDESTQRAQAALAAFNARIEALGEPVRLDAVTENELRAVIQATTPLADGVGFRMIFVRRAEEGETEAPPDANLVVTCRAYLGSRSMPSAVKCEAVFGGTAMNEERYLRIAIALPIYQGGRRRLLSSVRDLQTLKPVELPPLAAELFHEKHMIQLQAMSRTPLPTAGLGSVVKGALGGLFKR